MEAAFAGSALLIIIAIVVLGLIVHALFLHIAAKMVNVNNATFGRAIIVVLLGDIVAGAISGLMAAIPIVGFLSPLVYLLALLWFTTAIYSTTWMKAFLVQLISLVITATIAAIFVVIAVIVFGVSLAGLTGGETAALPGALLAALDVNTNQNYTDDVNSPSTLMSEEIAPSTGIIAGLQGTTVGPGEMPVWTVFGPGPKAGLAASSDTPSSDRISATLQEHKEPYRYMLTLENVEIPVSGLDPSKTYCFYWYYRYTYKCFLHGLVEHRSSGEAIKIPAAGTFVLQYLQPGYKYVEQGNGDCGLPPAGKVIWK